MNLSDFQARLKILVSAAPLLTSRPVLVEEKGNLVSELEIALQTQSLAVVIALSSGSAKDPDQPRRGVWKESFEVVVHRGLLDTDDVPSTLDVLDQLRGLLHGAFVVAGKSQSGAFSCSRHDLREGGDGTYARVLNVTVENVITYTGS